MVLYSCHSLFCGFIDFSFVSMYLINSLLFRLCSNSGRVLKKEELLALSREESIPNSKLVILSRKESLPNSRLVILFFYINKIFFKRFSVN